MPVDGGMQKMMPMKRIFVLTEAARAFIRLGVAIADSATQHPPPTAGRDLAELLDIDMHHVTAPGRFHPSDHLPGRPIQPAQFGQSVPCQYPMNGGRVNTQQIADSCWPPTTQDTHLDDAPLAARWYLVRTVMGP